MMKEVDRYDLLPFRDVCEDGKNSVIHSSSGWLVKHEDYAALEAERDKLAAKGRELCREAAHVYEKYNVTQIPDMDLVDCQTLQGFSDLAGGSINTAAYANLRKENCND